MQPTTEVKRETTGGFRRIRWFMGLLWRERPLAVSVNVAFMVVQGLIPATQLVVTQRLLDVVAAAAAGGGDWRDMVVWIAALAGVSGLQAILEAGRGVARAYLRESAGWRLQQLVIEKAGLAPLEEFEHPSFHDRLQRARQAATWRSFVIFENALRIAEVGVNLASYLVLLVQAYVGLPLVLVLGATPNLISQLRRGEERYQLRRRQTPRQRRVDYLVELLTDRESAKELRLYQLGSFFIDAWHDAASELRNERLQLARIQQIRVGVARAAAILGFAGAVALLLRQAAYGVIGLGGFVALMQAATRFQNQLVQVLRQIGNVYEESLYLSDLQSFVQYEREESGELTSTPRARAPSNFKASASPIPAAPRCSRTSALPSTPVKKSPSSVPTGQARPP